MRFGNLAGRMVLVTGSGAIDIEAASGGRLPPNPQAALERWDEVLGWAQGADGEPVPLAETELRAPVPRPRQVFAIGMNYASHAAETNVPVPAFPSVFTKFATCLGPPHAVVTLPSGNVDWEVELVAVVGRFAHHVSEADGWAHVAGVTVGQDLSERKVQLRPPLPQFSLGKSFPGFGPTGPLLVTPDELDDPDDLAISCTLNAELVQCNRTSELIFSVPALIKHLSSVVPLLAGDLIFTGTPAGIGASRTPPRYLASGDELVSTIEGVGSIRTCFDTNDNGYVADWTAP